MCMTTFNTEDDDYVVVDGPRCPDLSGLTSPATRPSPRGVSSGTREQRTSRRSQGRRTGSRRTPAATASTYDDGNYDRRTNGTQDEATSLRASGSSSSGNSQPSTQHSTSRAERFSRRSGGHGRSRNSGGGRRSGGRSCTWGSVDDGNGNGKTTTGDNAVSGNRPRGPRLRAVNKGKVPASEADVGCALAAAVQEGTGPVADAVPSPELHVPDEKPLVVGGAGELACLSHSLIRRGTQNFTTAKLMTGSNCEVYTADLDGTAASVKRFVVPADLPIDAKISLISTQLRKSTKHTHDHIVPPNSYAVSADYSELALVYPAFISTLSDYIRDNPGATFPARDRVRAVHHVSGALAYFHNSGVAHKYIRASNVVVYHREDGVLCFALFDVSTACEVDDDEAGGAEIPASKFTSVAQLTPLKRSGYFAPEQESGHSGLPADVYCLGIIMLELLTGRPPISVDGSLRNTVFHMRANETTWQEDLDKDCDFDWEKVALPLFRLAYKCTGLADQRESARDVAVEVSAVTDVLATETHCHICGEYVGLEWPVRCDSEPVHVMCGDCASSYVGKNLKSRRRLLRSKFQILCPSLDCKRPLKTHVVLANIHRDVANNFTQFLMEIAGAENEDHVEWVERLHAATTVDERKEAVYKIVTEDVMVLKCPACHTAFDGFENCAALDCENCEAEFCALCLEHSAPGDGHRHVATVHAEVIDHDGVYVTDETAAAANNEMRLEKLRVLFRSISEEQGRAECLAHAAAYFAPITSEAVLEGL